MRLALDGYVAGPVTVVVDRVDALAVGLSIKTLIQGGRITDLQTRQCYERIADQLAAAARAQVGGRS